ncbi:MAG: sce7726 family protein [Deltaproteobacteria bacterium]
MRDCDVRSALHTKVLADHYDQPDTLVLNELGLWYGTARVDVAVINGRIHGFEIKSDADTLERLDGQAAVYSAVLDRVTLVVGEKHLSAAQSRIPDWWGIKVARQGARQAVHFAEMRRPTDNPSMIPVAVAALLWCHELEDLLGECNSLRGVKGKSRDILSRRAAEVLNLSDLRAAVRARLKARHGWRVVAPQT